MKGSASDILPMLVVVVLSVLLAWQAISSADTLGEEVSQSFSDLTNVADTMKTTDIFFYSYLRDASVFSVNQATYDIARDPDRRWDGLNIHRKDITDLHSKVDTEANRYFFNEYSVDEFTTTACSVDEDDFNIYQPYLQKTLDTPRISQNVTSDLSNFNMRCTFNGGSTVTYQATEDEVSALYSSDGNRFYQMANGTIEYFKRLDSILEPETKTEFSNEPGNSPTAVCRDVGEVEAREMAHSNAVRYFGNVADEIRDVVTLDPDWPDGLSMSIHLLKSYGDEGLGVEDYEVREFKEDCGCDLVPEECDDPPCGYELKFCEEETLHVATVFIKDLKYEYDLEDERYKIPVEGGFKSLEFIVYEFYHKLEDRGFDSSDSGKTLRISGVEENSRYKIQLGRGAVKLKVNGEGSVIMEEGAAEINGPIKEARIRFECPIDGVNEINVPESTAGPRIYVNSQPLSIRELRDGGFARGECGGP